MWKPPGGMGPKDIEGLGMDEIKKVSTCVDIFMVNTNTPFGTFVAAFEVIRTKDEKVTDFVEMKEMTKDAPEAMSGNFCLWEEIEVV